MRNVVTEIEGRLTGADGRGGVIGGSFNHTVLLIGAYERLSCVTVMRWFGAIFYDWASVFFGRLRLLFYCRYGIL